MSPRTFFLEKSTSLAAQVAEVLLEGHDLSPIDLGDTEVWIPTAGAGRRIRHALAEEAARRNTGVLAPRFFQPMQAILPKNPPRPIATRTEREIAWAEVFRETPPEEWETVIPQADVLGDVAGLLGAGGMVCDLCDLLAEGGFDPANPLLQKICGEEDDRWEQLPALYATYLTVLKKNGLADPNDLRLRQLLTTPTEPGPKLKRIVVACVADLPGLASRYLENRASCGVEILILVWKPGKLAGGFDGWGRPLPAEWNAAELPFAAGQIAVAHRAEDEAETALDFLSNTATAGDFSLTLADETLAPAFATEIVRRGGVAFRPEGKNLGMTEPAVVALEWTAFQREGDLRVLRNLAQRPHFLRWLGTKSGLAPSQILSACDTVIIGSIAETLDQARSYFADTPLTDDRQKNQRDAAIKLLDALADYKSIEAVVLLIEAWSGTAIIEGVNDVLEILREVSESSLTNQWPEAREAAFLRALSSAQLFESAPPEAIQLTGWLESPWLENTRLAVCGCVEGKIPSSISEHAFLPDSRRKLLGLSENEQRLARDIYLMHCLLQRHGGEDLRLSFSKFGADGSPSLPSRLLFRCAGEDLPARVLELFARVSSNQRKPVRQNGWRWHLPEKLTKVPRQKISPTAFKDYLACPFRFYWKKVLGLDAYDNDPREMDAMRFGTLTHLALEAWGRKAPDESNAAQIEKIVLEQLDLEATKMLGNHPVAAVRVQLEAIKTRLRAFARVQAAEVAAGWKILEVEKRILADGDAPLRIGPLPLSAQIDRIEEHPEQGIRILDYKTFSTLKQPEKTHLGGAAANVFLPEAQTILGGKAKCWVDLQLPLYRYIAESLYPGRPVQTAYFILPADPSETSLVPLELTEDQYDSAITCAAAVADRVSRGVFWPPQEHRQGYDDPFAALFLNGGPEKCFTAETIEFLKGKS